MTRLINLNVQLIGEYLEAKDYTSLASYLKTVFKVERTSTGAPLKFQFSADAINVLLAILAQILNESVSEAHNSILKELFRSLRNYATNADVQNYLIRNNDFLNNVKHLLVCRRTIDFVDVTQLVLQFLNNLIVSNCTAAVKVYDIIGCEILNFLKQKLHSYEATALLYNISLHKELLLEFDTYCAILDIYESNVEFAHFLLEKFLTQQQFWHNYARFDVKMRTSALGLIRDQQIKGECLLLPEVAVKTLTKQFVESGDIIFQTVSSNKANLEPYEISLLLEVISSICSSEDHLKALQTDKDLLITSGVLLINIHRLGKQNENCFTSIQSLAEIRDPSKVINSHPAFGFKADLVRIVGNLCWKNKMMQDLTREAELIPVILDCCNMDARNPFIMQWAILAVRNLCEGNLNNQQVIAGLHQEGTVSSSVLEEMGLNLHCDNDNSLKLVPLDALRNRK